MDQNAYILAIDNKRKHSYLLLYISAERSTTIIDSYMGLVINKENRMIPVVRYNSYITLMISIREAIFSDIN